MLVRVGPDQVSTTYGLLVLGKVAALMVLGVIGWLHRRGTVAAVVERAIDQTWCWGRRARSRWRLSRRGATVGATWRRLADGPHGGLAGRLRGHPDRHGVGYRPLRDGDIHRAHGCAHADIDGGPDFARARRTGDVGPAGVAPAGPANPPGPWEWLQAFTHSWVVRMSTHPLVALGMYVGSFYVVYFTGLYDVAAPSHGTHLAMNTHFLLMDYAYY